MPNLGIRIEAADLFLREVGAINDANSLSAAETSIRTALEGSEGEEVAVRQEALALINEAKRQLRRPPPARAANHWRLSPA